MRMNPCHDTKSPPGQLKYNFEKPLQGLVKDYESERRQKALQEAFKEGERVGYLRGLTEARRPLKHLDPNSEESR